MCRRVVHVLALALLAAFVAAGCGGESEAEKEREREEGRSAFTAVCEGSEVSDPGLPASFPKPDGVTYLKTSEAGPSQVVDGTFDGDLDEAYDSYEQAVEDAGYNILFQEKEEEDAEISYEGEGRTGQIALRDSCDNGKLAIHITSRPE